MIRKILEFAIDKPLLNHILLVFIFLLSVFSYINIPKEIFPPIYMDKIVINGAYVGTSADVLDKMAVKTIEDDLANIDEIDEVKSEIRNGFFTITADIKPHSNNISVLNDVKDILSSIKKDLPSDMNEPVAKLKTHAFPLVLIAISGDVSKKVLLKKADELKAKLSELKDLSEISIRGDADEELVIKINEQKIKAYGLKPALVVQAISNISSIFPVGTIKEKGHHLYISTYNGEKTRQDIQNIILNVAGYKLKLKDVADVSFELGNENELSHYNGKRNVSINVTKSEQGNAIKLVKQIRKILKQSREQNPQIDYEIYTDTSVWIKNRLNIVFSNIIFGLILVSIAMLIFINKGIAFVVALGIPVSFMIGLIASELLGYSLNMLSLLGALIALGMLVDEAIIVAENIYRYLEEGMDRREACIVGATEMFPAVLSATLTTIFAFLPMLLLTGEMGTFIRIIPIMITVLLLSSLFEAFYFLPLHAKDFLRVSQEQSFTKKLWKKLNGYYDKVLHFLFRKNLLSLIVMTSSILIATFFLAKHSKFQLFPEFDTTQVYVLGSVDVNSELEDTEKVVTKLEKLLLKNLDKDDVSSITSVVGFKLDAKNAPELGDNLFHIFIDLHERAPANFFDKYISPYLSIEYDKSLLIRKHDAYEIGKMVENILKDIKEEKENGKKVFKELSVKVPGAGVVAHDIEISLSGKSDKDIIKGINLLKQELSKMNGVKNIDDDMNMGEKELKLRINKYGQELGFNEQLLTNELRAYYLQGEYGKMFNQKGLVRIKIEGTSHKDINSINDIEVQIPQSDKFITLKEICDFITIQSFREIKKENGVRLRSVFASLDKKIITSAEVMKKLQPTFEKLKNDGFHIDIKGEEKENNKNKKEMFESAIIAIFLIFITLVWLFDSIKKSLIVISTIPLVFFGVFLGHLAMGLNLSMPGLIGIVGLAGVVVNDGLIMVSFIQSAKNTEELMQRAKTRLRPIMLTSITTVLGLSTLIFFASGQAMILQPMAVSLGFGLAWATVLNLLYVPLLYSVVYKIKTTISPR